MSSPHVSGPQEWAQFAPWANRQCWLYGCDLATELKQAREEGKDLSSVEREFARLMKIEADAGYMETMLTGKRGRKWFDAAMALIDRVPTLPLRRDYAFVEPDDLAGIRRQRARTPAVPAWRGTKRALTARVRGGFLGRVAGCLLGKPFECVDRASIRAYAEHTGNWPLQTYQREPSAAELRRILAGERKRPVREWQARYYINRLNGFPGDDDINYTLLGLLVMERHGRDFSPVHMADLWLGQLPLLSTCTAERVAYRNFIDGCLPPASATWRNPYREWIGAQIRADFFGYAAPGNPAQAAEWAWRDASISHVKNGIYGEMWVGAMLAAAFVLPTWLEIIRAGLAQVPRKSRLHAGVTRILDAHAAGASHVELIDSIHAEWDEVIAHDWCHTISNAQVVTAALLGGGDDFSEIIRLAVQAGFDTDCNGATCGSLWGVRHGDAAIPAKWLKPMRNRTSSSLREFPTGPLDETADRVAAVAVKLAG